MGYHSPNQYSISFIHATHDPADSSTMFWGSLSNPTVTSGIRRIYIPKSGRMTKVTLMQVAVTVVGSAEDISAYVRVNDTTDYLIATVGLSAVIRPFLNYSMNVPVVAGDYIELKMVYPAWATNPTGVFGCGTAIVECD